MKFGDLSLRIKLRNSTNNGGADLSLTHSRFFQTPFTHGESVQGGEANFSGSVFIKYLIEF